MLLQLTHKLWFHKIWCNVNIQISINLNWLTNILSSDWNVLFCDSYDWFKALIFGVLRAFSPLCSRFASFPNFGLTEELARLRHCLCGDSQGLYTGLQNYSSGNHVFIYKSVFNIHMNTRTKGFWALLCLWNLLLSASCLHLKSWYPHALILALCTGNTPQDMMSLMVWPRHLAIIV